MQQKLVSFAIAAALLIFCIADSMGSTRGAFQSPSSSRMAYNVVK